VPRNRQQVPHAQRRAEVLAAARKILLREGYTHTTTAAIAQEAGLAPNAVRWYFPHKDDALAAVVDELVDTHLSQDHGRDLDSLVEAVHALDAFRGLAPAVAERARHSTAVAACAARVHELLAEHADRLLAGSGNPLTRAAITAVLANEITNPFATEQPEVLRYTLRRLLC
jgi:AcrR family transcriptional regulator